MFSESNGDCQKMPSGFTRFELPNNQAFEIDVVATIRDLRDLAEKCRADGKNHYQYLDEVILHLAEKTTFTLNHGQAEWLLLQLDIVLAKKKQQQLEEIRTVQTSLLSTTSTPSS